MSIQLRARLRRRVSKDAQPDNRLSFFDQAAFLSLQATGRHQLIQGVWVYQRPVDMEGIRRFHRNFGYGLFGRLIEQSPLPFGRHRWVAMTGPTSDLEIAETARPRDELSDWIDERAQLPIDPEHGPGWHMAVQPLTDGSTAISVVGSHCLGDGVGAMVSVFDAVQGNRPDFGHPPPRSRTRLRAALADARETVRGTPEVGRTIVATAKLLARRRHDISRAGQHTPAAIDDGRAGENVILPFVEVFLDTNDWDARAAALGGNSYSLVVALGVKIADRIGRRRAEDGAVSLLIAINDRTLGDTRAHAMGISYANVDPTSVTEDLSAVRVVVKEAIKAVREKPDEALQILPLIPFMPKWAMKRLADVFIGAADLPVSCSNVGDMPPEIARIDGTAADYCFQRGVDQHVTRGDLERSQGQLVLVSSRTGGKIGINVLAYQPGAANSRAWLRDLVVGALAEFGLAGTVL